MNFHKLCKRKQQGSNSANDKIYLWQCCRWLLAQCRKALTQQQAFFKYSYYRQMIVKTQSWIEF